MYVLWNTTQNKYVAPPGSTSSFTRRLEEARIYKTINDAVGDACGDEIAYRLDDLVRLPGR